MAGKVIIKSFQPEAGNWIYKIEMIINPDMGIARID
jgi:hypothetical protein